MRMPYPTPFHPPSRLSAPSSPYTPQYHRTLLPAPLHSKTTATIALWLSGNKTGVRGPIKAVPLRGRESEPNSFPP